MSAWYQTQIRNHGLVRATRLFCRVIWHRVFVIVRNSTLPARLVIEQVEDVHVVLSEFASRVGFGPGQLIISSGQGKQENTIEFGFSDKSLSGNRRLFGVDSSRTLADAGFNVRPMGCDLSGDDCGKYEISPEPFYRCIKL